MKTQNFCKIFSIGLFTLFLTLVTPSSSSIFDTSDGSTLTMYGMANLVQRDGVTGDITFEQTVHNAITNEGEAYLLNQTFNTTSQIGDRTSNIGSICITDNQLDLTTTAAMAALELLTATSAETLLVDSYATDTIPCISDVDANLILITSSATASTATIGPLKFTSNVNLDDGGYIRALLICETGSTDKCTDTLFAVVNTTAVQLTGLDSIDLTYTFDITSSTS